MPDKENPYNNIRTMSLSEQLQQHIRTLQLFDESLDDYIYIYDMTAGRVFLTDKIREKFPIPPAGEDGNDFEDWNNIVYAKDRPLMNHYRDLLIRGEIGSFDIEYRILDRAGNKVWVSVKGMLRQKENTQSCLLVGRISEIISGGMVDNLTGLFSRGKFMQDIKSGAKEHDGYLMILGIDNFRNINITQGRAFGDTMLRQVAEMLDQHTRYPMELYRLDGDCFAVNFIGQQQDDVEAFYRNVRSTLENICTISAGVVNYRCDDGMDGNSIYLYAETALGQAKKEGKNRMLFFSEEEYQKNLVQVELLAEMRGCILDGCRGFSLEYQPQVSCQNFQIHGVEALLRYESPTRGRISPVEFIPLLEQAGLICQVGEWVLRTAVDQCKKWRKSLPHLHMSVNISYIQLQQEGITNLVLDVLKEADLPGNALTLEMTESIQLQNYDYFNKIFYIWKQNGIRISIDDFGTGYSSLSYLKRIEINEVKIDRCFVSRVQYNAYNFRLLSNMIELAHSTNIEVCCEGVETAEELVALQELNADILQGYFFAKPYSVELFEQTYIFTHCKPYLERVAKESKLHKLESKESKEFLEELRKEEIGNITENMDEMVCVVDVETYELYYLNATGRRLTGVYDYKGRKCYEVLQGKNEPCEFCTNSQLCREKFLIWEMENTFLNKHFILKDKLIPWKGGMARAEIAIDITEKEVISQSIQKRLNLQSAIVDVCKVLFSNVDVEQTALRVLEIIGEFSEAERVYILKNSSRDDMWELGWEWCAEGKDSIASFFPVAKGSCDEESKKSRIITHILCGGKTAGVVCVDRPQYREEGDELVATIAGFLSYTIPSRGKCEQVKSMLEIPNKNIAGLTKDL